MKTGLKRHIYKLALLDFDVISQDGIIDEMMLEKHADKQTRTYR